MIRNAILPIGVLLLIQITSLAQTPERISFQGKLQSEGTPVTDTLGITFTFYDSTGSNVWSESHPDVSVIDGVFSVVLGDLTPLQSLNFDHPYEVGISAGADPEMSPRSGLTSVAHALNLRHLRVTPETATRAPSLIGGSYANAAADDAEGVTISGGGVIERVISSDGLCDENPGLNANFAGSDWATIGGGLGNYSCGYATVGGGGGNSAAGESSTVSGGLLNRATMSYASVGGGQQNKADGRGSTIPGGEFNTAAGDYSFAAGLIARASHDGSFVWADKSFDTAGFGTTGENQFLIRARGGVGIGTEAPTSQLTVHGVIESDTLGFKFPDGSVQTTAAIGGTAGWTLAGNTGTDPATNFLGTIDSTAFEIRVHNERVVRIEPGVGSLNTRAPNLIAGDSSNAVVGASVAGATIGGGGGIYNGSPEPNTVSASFGTISGGRGNSASGGGASIGGGHLNVANGGLSTVGGGYNNQATGNVAVVGGGYQNYATASNSFVGAGFQNVAGAENTFIGAGSNNSASGSASVVGGGSLNHARQSRSFVGGGQSNDADADYAAIGGGHSNETTGSYAFVGGGRDNVASGDSSTVAGGRGNVASGPATTIAGGGANQASGQNSSIGGGRGNQATMFYSTVAGGSGNLATQNYGSVSGGWTNWVDSEYGSVGGGFNNITQGNFATIPGGYQNASDGHSSFAAGYKARAVHDGTFVWNDRSVTTFPDWFESTGTNQFLIRAAGGVGIGTNNPLNQFHVARSVSAAASVQNHVAVIDNTSTGNSADVLALRVGRSTFPESGNAFISFKYNGNTSAGFIRGDGSGGIEVISSSADFAEYLPKINPTEKLDPGDVVGVFAGQVTRSTEGADQVMVVSTSPIVTGNSQHLDDEEHSLASKIAFIGQAPVRVRGPVEAGDLLIASGLSDGTAVAVKPMAIEPSELRTVVGTSWESNLDPGVKKVNTAVGIDQLSVASGVIEALKKSNSERDLRIVALEERLAVLERLLTN